MKIYSKIYILEIDTTIATQDVEKNCLNDDYNSQSVSNYSQTLPTKINPLVNMIEAVKISFIAETKKNELLKDYSKHEEQFNVFLSNHLNLKNNNTELLKAKYKEDLEKLKKINLLIKEKREQAKNEETEIKQNISKLKNGK
jgi:predicted phage-related endonuclease